MDIEKMECTHCERIGEMVRQGVLSEEESTDEYIGQSTVLYQCGFCKMVNIRKE